MTSPRDLWIEYRIVRVAAVIASIAVVALLVWLLLVRSSGSESSFPQEGGGPVVTSESALSDLAAKFGHPVFWAGARPGQTIEGTLTSSDYTYVRYLPSSADVGNASPDFLTVGTYPIQNALSDLRAYARRTHSSIKRVPGGGVAVPVRGAPTSVFFARPGDTVQVEVYDPTEGHALDLIRAGEIVPVP